MPYRNEKDAELRRAYQREYSRRLYAEGRTWAQRNKVAVREKRRCRTLLVYNLTPETWEAEFERQNRACAICCTKETPQWHTEHDHDRGTFRGILCKKCNNGIGQLQDSPAILRAAAEYIEKQGK